MPSSSGETAIIALTIISGIATLIIITLGLAVMWGLVGILNLAHGEFIVLGALLELRLMHAGLSFWLALPVVALAVGLVGIVVERAIIRFLYGRPLEAIVATWGLSLIMIQLMSMTFGTLPEGIKAPFGKLTIGGYGIAQYSVVLIGVAALLATAVYLLLTRTAYGLRARAVGWSSQMTAATTGVNVARTSMITFALGALLTGLGGALLTPLTVIVPTSGASFVPQAFMAVVVGGALPLSGALSGAGVLGFVNGTATQLSSVFIGQVVLLLSAIVILRFLPAGLSSRWSLRL